MIRNLVTGVLMAICAFATTTSTAQAQYYAGACCGSTYPGSYLGYGSGYSTNGFYSGGCGYGCSPYSTMIYSPTVNVGTGCPSIGCGSGCGLGYGYRSLGCGYRGCGSSYYGSSYGCGYLGYGTGCGYASNCGGYGGYGYSRSYLGCGFRRHCGLRRSNFCCNLSSGYTGAVGACCMPTATCCGSAPVVVTSPSTTASPAPTPTPMSAAPASPTPTPAAPAPTPAAPAPAAPTPEAAPANPAPAPAAPAAPAPGPTT